ADLGGIVARELDVDDGALGVEVDVGIDQVGLGEAGRRRRVALRGRLLGRVRIDLLERGFGHALDAVDLRVVKRRILARAADLLRRGAARALSGQEAWPLRRAQRIAGDPDELVALARVDGPGVVVVAKSERDAARAVRIDERLAVIVAIVEADVVAPD